MLEAFVATEFRTRLLMSESDRLPLDESYFELGLTSIGATEIQQRLEEVLGRRIDSSSLFNNPTVGHLLAHLRSEVLGDLFASAPVPAGADSPMDPAPRIADPLQLDAAQDVPVAPSAPRSSPKDLLNNLLDELYQP